MESGRDRLIDEGLTVNLRAFLGTNLAQVAWSRGLPPDFSRVELVRKISEMRGRVEDTLANRRMFAEPEFLKVAPWGARAAEWDLSRLSLLTAMEGLPAGRLRVSFAHTDGVALAIAAVVPEGAGLGVDLERIGREISDAAFARFTDPSEHEFGVNRLDHWVMKEAAYKAHPRSGDTIVADYAITGRGPRDDEFSVLCRKGVPRSFRAVVGAHETYRYAWAMTRS